jgi:uncharacterized membrane protein YdjX (TVP38/TMEM64 family)
MKPPTPPRRLLTWLLPAALVLALALLAWMHRDRIDRESLVALAESLPLPWLLAAYAVLPVIGFPISPLLVVLGLRLGFGGGMAVATAGVCCHHLAAYRLTRGWLHDRLQARLERGGHRIPRLDAGHRVWFTVAFAAIHGPPYAVKLHLLALTGIPFRVYFWAGAPVYAAFCAIPIGAGSAVGNFNAGTIALVVGVSLVLLLAGILIRRRTRPAG